MAGNALVETLPIREAAEVERTTPAVFVDVRREVVVAARLSEFKHRISRGRKPHCLVKVAYSALRDCDRMSIGRKENG